MSNYFHLMADEQNDAHDHDEYHAAGAVLDNINLSELNTSDREYISRWIEGLKVQIDQ